MKILLLGDGSNFNACLGQALARLGHDVTVASDGGGWMKTYNDISLKRVLPGKPGGALLYYKLLHDNAFSGFDIVSLINPSFVNLRPHRLKEVFNRLKKRNGAVFLSAIGLDNIVVDFLSSPDCSLRYSEYFSAPGKIFEPNRNFYEKALLWLKEPLASYCEFIYDNICGVTTALYEYHLAYQKVMPSDMIAYTGIPVSSDAFSAPDSFDDTAKINIFLGRHSYRKSFKGTDRLESVARKLVTDYPDKCFLTLVEDQKYSSYLKSISSADIVLDQLYSYTPATNALLALAMGKTVLSGAEPEYYDFIGEKTLKPIINALPDEKSLYDSLAHLIHNPSDIAKAALEGPLFVKKHNDALLVARRHLDFWTSRL